MKTAIIVAIANNNAIGKDNKLLCHLPEDLKHFKEITKGHTVIMGRNTFLSLPKGALPNRRNIVLSPEEEVFPAVKPHIPSKKPCNAAKRKPKFSLSGAPWCIIKLTPWSMNYT